jgi:EpsI family protein
LLFVAGALVTAIVANWIRAYLTVLVAHLSGNRFGTGFDHIVFAEILYGAVLLLVFWLGTRWREDRVDSPMAEGSDPTAVDLPRVSARRGLSASLAAAALLSIWPLVSLGTGAESHATSSKIVDIEPRAGWVRTDEPAANWQPQLSNPSRVRLQTFMKDGQRVSIYLGAFDRPRYESKLTASVNQLVSSEDPHWKLVQSGVAEVHRLGEVMPVRTGTLVGRDVRLIAWHWYWVDGTLTTSSARAALVQVLARLRGRSEMSAWVTVFTAEGEGTTSAPLLLEAFLSDMLDSIDQAID